MPGTPGKNKVERAFRILWDDLGTGSGTPRDITGDLVPGSIKGGGLVFDEADMSGVSELVYNFLADRAQSEISGQFLMNDLATTGAFTVIKGSVGGKGTLTLQWGSNGNAPSTGDPQWQGEYVLLSGDIAMLGNKPGINAKWKPTGSVAPAWGVMP